MKLTAIKADITKLKVDAIVNAANNAMMIGGGVDGAIHAAAGQGLIDYNAQYHGFGCPTGQVKVTPGFNLPALSILHTVGPDMRLYTQKMGDLLLEACYDNCMRTAVAMYAKTIAFPAISTGIFGFDKKCAAKIAVETLTLHFANDNIDVTFACFSDEDTAIVQEAIDAKDDEIHYISWAMYNNTEAYDSDDWILDLDTDAPDGIHSVFHCHQGKIGESRGVKVKNGKFVIEPTLRAVAKARNASGYRGKYLVELIWDNVNYIFKAYTDS